MATATNPRLTYEQWAARPETTRIEELLDGELVVSPTPRLVHQRAVTRLAARLDEHARRRGDLALGPSIGIRTGRDTVVVPDALYFLAPHEEVADDQHTVRAVPDLVVEVLSPSTRAHDLVRKRRVLEAHHVPEVWFVDTDARRIEQVVLQGDGRYGAPRVHEPGAVVEATAVPDLRVAVDDVVPTGDEGA